MNIYLEIFGYCGTALVLLSMMMTSVVKLRAFNSVGSLISMIYSYMCNAWPVVLLNFGLLLINVIQLIRLHRTKVTFCCRPIKAVDSSLQHFLSFYEQDIRSFFPKFSKELQKDRQVYMVYRDADPAGVLIGTLRGTDLDVVLDYTTPQYRDCSVAAFLFQQLKEQGIETLTATADTKAHSGYLKKMGFVDQGDKKVKQL